MASGEMSDGEFTNFLSEVFAHLVAYSDDGAIHFQCIDWRHIVHMMSAGQAAYTELKNICVWVKSNAGMGSLYRSQHELVLVFKAGTAPHLNNIGLGKYGRNRSNVWTYAGASGFGDGREDLVLHPTVKPVALVADAIRDCSHRNGIILDPFVGSGTTLIAAERTGRVGYGIELDPQYCDIAVRRMQTACGLDAVLKATGEPFQARTVAVENERD
ncbi:DNA-methyltransferase [Bradyrhizobium sp. USDA 4519]